MEKINVEAWGRRTQFEFFSSVSDPFYSVTFKLDVTRLYDYVKREGLPFYYSLCYLVTQAINSVEAFAYGISGGEVVRFEKRSPSFTDLRRGSEEFYIVTMPCEGSMAQFCAAAREKSSKQTEFIDPSGQRDDLIYISCLPWVELTALTNERDFDPDDAIPRVAWGKFTECGGRRSLGMSLELNHRFVDGVHIGAFAQKLQALIEAL